MPHYFKDSARKLFTKQNCLTIPNLLSLLRFLMIPVIVFLYLNRHPYWATLMFALSGFTDVLDGWIARKFNQISDLGKILDPVADKLTQAAILFCLIVRYKRPVILLVALLVIKEIIQFIMGYLAVSRSAKVEGANWYGKASSAVLFVVVITLMVVEFPAMQPPWNTLGPQLLCGFSAIMLLISMVNYILFFQKQYKDGKSKSKQN